MNWLFDPFGFEFFRLGFAAALLAGALCGLVGTYVVLRGMSYIGHGLSHAVFGGAVVTHLMGLGFALGAGIWGLASTLLVHRVARRRGIGADAAIGVITTASFALGVALISRSHGFTRNIESALFGNVLGAHPANVLAIAAVLAGALVMVLVGYRSFLFVTFDAQAAELSGVSVARVDLALAGMLALSVMVTMQLLGVTMIAAILVTPAATARLVTTSFAGMLVRSTVFGALTGAIGMLASYHLDLASGPAVVLTGALGFAVTYLATAAYPFAIRSGTTQ